MMVSKRSPSKEYRFFLYDPDNGVSFYKDKKERDLAASSAIKDYLDGTVLSDVVEEICAGEVSAIIQKIEVEVRPPAEEIDEDGIDESGEYWEPDCGEKCYYGMLEI